MPLRSNDNPSHPRFLRNSLLVAALLASSPGFGALREAIGTRSALWELVILAIVLIVTLLSGALPLAALRQWQGAWRSAALLPLGVLAAWVAVLLISGTDSDPFALWVLSVFGWAMLNMIYMVLLFTIKRILAKADEQKP